MPGPKFAYLSRMFPQTSETFVANEILYQERLGLPLLVVSTKPPVERVEHEAVRQIGSPVHYMVDPPWRQPGQLIRAARAAQKADKERFATTFRYVLHQAFPGWRIDIWKRLLQAYLLSAQVRAHGIEHVHAHFANVPTDVALLTNLLTGVPFSFTGHARDVYLAKPNDLRRKMAAAKFVVTCTAANLRYLEEIAGPELRDRIHLVYHGVNTSKFGRRETEPAREEPLILSVGRLVPKKGLDDLIDALAILRDRGVRFHAIIVGKGEERSRLESQVRKLALDSIVSLPGAVSQEELVGIYREATVFALPCRVMDDGDRDGLPNVLLEAMSTGLPVVSSPISGIPEAVHNGENGLLVAERDPPALASALQLLLRDGQLRRRLGANARVSMETEMSIDVMAQRLSDLFLPSVGLRSATSRSSVEAAKGEA